ICLFQAEDGIRDDLVTGVQTCALPILHQGATSRHLPRLLKFAEAANLRQVHLIHVELFDELRLAGFVVWAGLMGENITTRDIDRSEERRVGKGCRRGAETASPREGRRE